ncbi:MAG TPA: AAA family ATPase, partial [Lysobacter sp.]|nr:AAA family ATPase [Lysobacter sp.]
MTEQIATRAATGAEHRIYGLVEGAVRDARRPGVSTPSVTPLNPVALDPGLRVVQLNEFLNENIPPREAIMSPWLLTQSLSMIYAWRGVGKTFIAMNIAYAV